MSHSPTNSRGGAGRSSDTVGWAVRKRLDMSHFNPNAIIRGFQLTFVGAHRALQNPAMFTSEHYYQAACAVLAGIAIRILVQIPIMSTRVFIWILSFIYPLETVSWDDYLIDGLNFIGDHVLQLPLFLMALMRYVVPTLDNLFMLSLQWVDRTYVQKHQHDSPATLRGMYYRNLERYTCVHEGSSSRSNGTARALSMFLYKFVRRGLISIAMFALSYLPVVGGLVLPAASFYTFNRAVGPGLSGIIFGLGVFLPRRYLVIFLQTYFASRSLTRELLEPYFARVQFTKSEKQNWFKSRGGVLFGFGLGFYALVRVPLVGVLAYGIAEASTAYLITKITDPPPPPGDIRAYAASQEEWKNKHRFLDLSLADIDRDTSGSSKTM